MNNSLQIPSFSSFIDFYQIRITANYLHLNTYELLYYDTAIFDLTKRIATKVEQFNELIRNMLPTLKIKTSYITNSILKNTSSQIESQVFNPQQNLILLQELIEDLVSLNTEINKLKLPLRSTIDFLLETNLNDKCKNKVLYYEDQKKHIKVLKEKNILKLTEMKSVLDLVTKAEDIILKNNLSYIFDKVFPSKDKINAINIESAEKDILILAIDTAKQLLSLIGDGLAFMDWVKTRHHLNNLINDLEEKIYQLEKYNNQILSLMALTQKITYIDEKKSYIVQTLQSLLTYIQVWDQFIKNCLVSPDCNAQIAIQGCYSLMQFLSETEYQYNRELVD